MIVVMLDDDDKSGLQVYELVVISAKRLCLSLNTWNIRNSLARQEPAVVVSV